MSQGGRRPGARAPKGNLNAQRDRLILLPPVDDADSIIQNTGTHEQKQEMHPGHNQPRHDTASGQSEIS